MTKITFSGKQTCERRQSGVQYLPDKTASRFIIENR